MVLIRAPRCTERPRDAFSSEVKCSLEVMAHQLCSHGPLHLVSTCLWSPRRYRTAQASTFDLALHQCDPSSHPVLAAGLTAAMARRSERKPNCSRFMHPDYGIFYAMEGEPLRAPRKGGFSFVFCKPSDCQQRSLCEGSSLSPEHAINESMKPLSTLSSAPARNHVYCPVWVESGCESMSNYVLLLARCLSNSNG